MGKYLLLSTAERWDKQQVPDGSNWEPLNEFTQKSDTKNKNSIL
ncbi:phage virion morphogenesis protein [Pseudoalteromonas umbrosa]